MVSAAARKEHALAVLSINALEKRFGDIEVLKSVSLEMSEGEFLVLVGPSGCGKSTLLNCIAGLEDISGGQVLIAGRDVTQVPPRDRDIAMVFQSYALYPTMTVAENIAFGMKVRGVSKQEQTERVNSVAQLLQIDHLLDRKPAHLSGGQRQRVAMGRALVRDPMLFLFDEPLSNLDAKLRVEMRTEIKQLHERMGASIVYVTHDQVEAMTLGTRIVVMKDGIIQQIGTPSEIYEQPTNMFVADFMGSPPMNLIDAWFTSAKGGLRIQLGDTESGPSFVDRDPPDALRAFVDQPIVVGIRPEALSINLTAVADFNLPVTLIENAGSDTYATLGLDSQDMVARFPGRTRLEANKAIGISVDIDTVCYFDPQTSRRII